MKNSNFVAAIIPSNILLSTNVSSTLLQRKYIDIALTMEKLEISYNTIITNLHQHFEIIISEAAEMATNYKMSITFEDKGKHITKNMLMSLHKVIGITTQM